MKKLFQCQDHADGSSDKWQILAAGSSRFRYRVQRNWFPNRCGFDLVGELELWDRGWQPLAFLNRSFPHREHPLLQNWETRPNEEERLLKEFDQAVLEFAIMFTDGE